MIFELIFTLVYFIAVLVAVGFSIRQWFIIRRDEWTS